MLDTAKRSARRAGRWLELTPKEFGVLELLLAAQGRVVSAEELLARVWDEAADPFTGAVKVTISRLRAKLGEPPVIETIAKAGYRIGGSRCMSPDRGSDRRPGCACPRRTARLRFTAVYGGLFLLSGAALVATTYVLFERATEYRAPQLPQVPHTPAIQGLQQQLAPAALRHRPCLSSHRPSSQLAKTRTS